jgi:hypothetical protein
MGLFYPLVALHISPSSSTSRKINLNTLSPGDSISHRPEPQRTLSLRRAARCGCWIMVTKEFLDSDRVNFLIWRFVTPPRRLSRPLSLPSSHLTSQNLTERAVRVE